MNGSNGSRPRRPVAALAVGTVAALASGLFLANPAAAADEGHVYPFGNAAHHGEPGPAAGDVLGMAATPTGNGYWLATSDGGVHAFGDAPDLGSAGGHGTVVDLAGSPTGQGYWVVTATGGVYAFGDAEFLGSLSDAPLNRPIVTIAATRTGKGYWLVASDGGVFAFGDARYLGSTGDLHLNSPITAMAATPRAAGYWLVAEDGGVFTFGDAEFRGSLGDQTLTSPVTGMAATPSGDGYWLVTRHGDVHPFGDAADHGTFVDGFRPGAPVTDLAARPAGDGVWLSTGNPPPPPPPTSGFRSAGEPSDAQFDRLAQCESTSRWHINTGNGYYGGIQFSASSWRAVGGTGLPHEHSRETQIEMGRRLWRVQGWGAWPHCSRKLGYR